MSMHLEVHVRQDAPPQPSTIYRRRFENRRRYTPQATPAKQAPRQSIAASILGFAAVMVLSLFFGVVGLYWVAEMTLALALWSGLAMATYGLTAVGLGWLFFGGSGR